MILILVLLLASEPQLPPNVTCETIKSLVAEHGYIKAVLWAREHGYTWHQIREAKKCLR